MYTVDDLMGDVLIRGVTYEKEKFNQKEIEYFQNSLLEYIARLIDYCENVDGPSWKTGNEITTRERLELLAFSILSTIDGGSLGCGGFYVIPITEGHFTQPEYYIQDSIIEKYDIAGELHSNLHKFIDKANKEDN